LRHLRSLPGFWNLEKISNSIYSCSRDRPECKSRMECWLCWIFTSKPGVYW